MLIEITEGKNRKSTDWVTQEIDWKEFVKKCSKPKRISLPREEWLSLEKEDRDSLKDCNGAFVGATFLGKERTLKNVCRRTMITLDADSATKHLWDDFIDNVGAGYASLMYSTFSHTSENPRYRICIPIENVSGGDINVREYHSLARKIAGMAGINNFDPTTFDINRLMYYPGTCKDGEFEFYEEEGEFMTPDFIKGLYDGDWRDRTLWPKTDKERLDFDHGHIENLLKVARKTNPLEIKGVVGAFCNIYSIEEAIEKFLPDVYGPAQEGRYTYLAGTSTNGLHLYDGGIFAYSFHATDPASGKLWNAYDLVALHKFGDLDKTVAPSTTLKARPSHKKMWEFVAGEGGDPQTKALLRKWKKDNFAIKNELNEEFDGIEEEEAEDDSWEDNLIIDGKKGYVSCTRNIKIVLTCDSKLKGAFRYNEFSNEIDVMRKLPWSKSSKVRPFDDDDDSLIQDYFSDIRYSIKGTDILRNALLSISKSNSYHPIHEYLKSVSWDGVKRAETLFIDHLGAEDTELNRAFTRKMLCAAVARVFRPGTKFDHVVVLTGAEGIGKSRLLAELGKPWFTDSFSVSMIEAKNNKAEEAIKGAWFVEISELAGLKKAEVESVKGFISKTEDKYRAAFGRKTGYLPRQCVLIGTTNVDDFLVSVTGDRRFWPIKVGVTGTLKDLSSYDRDQIWAEVYQSAWKNEELYVSGELKRLAEEKQKEHHEVDERTGFIEEFINSPITKNWYDLDIAGRRSISDHIDSESTLLRQKVLGAEIAVECFGMNPLSISSHNTKFIHNYMRKHPDWEYVKTVHVKGYKRGGGYIRKKII